MRRGPEPARFGTGIAVVQDVFGGCGLRLAVDLHLQQHRWHPVWTTFGRPRLEQLLERLLEPKTGWNRWMPTKDGGTWCYMILGYANLRWWVWCLDGDPVDGEL